MFNFGSFCAQDVYFSNLACSPFPPLTQSPWCCGDSSTNVCMNNTCVPVCPNTSNQLDHMLPGISPTMGEEDSCNVSKAEVIDTLNTLADGYTNFPQYEYADGSMYEYSVLFFRDNEGVLIGQFYQHSASLELGTFNGDEDSIVGNQVFFSGGDTDGCSKPRQATVTFLSCQCGGREEEDDHANVLAVERSTELPWLEASVVVTEPESCVYEMTIKSKCGSKAPVGGSNGDTGEDDEDDSSSVVEEVDEVSS